MWALLAGLSVGIVLGVYQQKRLRHFFDNTFEKTHSCWQGKVLSHLQRGPKGSVGSTDEVVQNSTPDIVVCEVVAPSNAVGSFEVLQRSAPDGASLEIVVQNNGSVDKVQNCTPDGVAFEVAAPNDEVDNVDNVTENSLPSGMGFEVVTPNSAIGSADEVVENSAPDERALEVVARNDAAGHTDKAYVVSLDVIVPKGAVGSNDGVVQNSPPDTVVREVVIPSTEVSSFELVQNSELNGAYLEVIAPYNFSLDNVQNRTPDGVAHELAAPNTEVDNVDDATENSLPFGMACEVVAQSDAVGSADEVVQNSAPDGITVEVVAPSDAVGHADKYDGVSLEVVVPKDAVDSADGVMQGAAPGAVHPSVPAQTDVAEDGVEFIEDDRLQSVYVLIPEGFEDLPIDMIFDDAMRFRISDTCRRSVPLEQFETLWPNGRRALLNAMQQGLEKSGRGLVMHGLELGAAQQLMERLAEIVPATIVPGVR